MASPITVTTINKMINRLDSDLEAVKKSTDPKATPERKHRVELLTEHIKDGLASALKDSETTWNGWLQGLRPMFSALSAETKELIGLVIGACVYDGGCIDTSKDVCDQIAGSVFYPGTAC